MSDQTPDGSVDSHRVRPLSPPMSVPVYNCIVYVSRHSSGQVRARVANLEGIEVDAPSQREALTQLVARFKQRVADCTARGDAIPWLDPPPTAAPDERELQIPVHL